MAEIKSSEIQQLITDMRKLNETKEYGVGLAAPQVGVPVALSIIGIKPTPTRPAMQRVSMTIINPSYTGIGRRVGLWEGCQSSGSGGNTLYGKALRFKRIHAVWHDEHAIKHQEQLEGFVAHVFQHEADHLHGILFMDRVRDTRTYMLATEFKKRILQA
ncbi:MAG: peptide deformylase [Candidatus Saccharimonadales bacterium]